MPNANIDTVAIALTWEFIHQKKALLERARSRRTLDVQRLYNMTRPKMDKMAGVILEWDIDPRVVMESAFAWARKNRHADGPMINMLYSELYLIKALGYRLEMPFEVVLEMKNKEFIYEDMDTAYEEFLERNKTQDIDLVFSSNVPIQHRYLLAQSKKDFESMVQLAPQLLEAMEGNRLLALWLERKGVNYEGVALLFNKNKNTNYE